MVDISTFEQNTVHYMQDCFGFITEDVAGYKHLYVVSDRNNAIDLSSQIHEEVFDFDTVEHLAEAVGERVVTVFTDYEKFCLRLLA